MDVFASFLLGHLIGDFALQTDLVYELKKRGMVGLWVHIGIHLGVTALLLQNEPKKWLAMAVLALVHFGLDWFKLHNEDKAQAPGFLIDQFLHLGVILIISLFVSDLKATLPSQVLYPALLYGLVPPILMFLWVWTNDLEAEKIRSSVIVQWIHKKAFGLSKRLGIPLLIAVAIGLLMAY